MICLLCLWFLGICSVTGFWNLSRLAHSKLLLDLFVRRLELPDLLIFYVLMCNLLVNFDVLFFGYE